MLILLMPVPVLRPSWSRYALCIVQQPHSKDVMQCHAHVILMYRIADCMKASAVSDIWLCLSVMHPRPLSYVCCAESIGSDAMLDVSLLG